MKHRLMRKITSVIAVSVLIYGCSASLEDPTVSFAGMFNGATTEDGRPVSLSVVETGWGYSGIGTYAGNPLVLSLMSSCRGIGELTYNGQTVPIAAELSYAGDELVLTGMTSAVVLQKSGAAEATPTGPYSGRYRSGGLTGPAAAIELRQSDDLVAGAGVLYNEKFVVSGRVYGADDFEGRALFSDGSEVKVTASRSTSDGSLTLVGLAGTLEFTRL